MKKFIFIFTISILIGFRAFAEQVTEQDALQIATSFFDGMDLRSHPVRTGKTLYLDMEKTPDSERLVISHVIRSEKGEANLFILNAAEYGHGFVIVSGDTDTGSMVLGYSKTGSFDYRQAPENVRDWLEGYSKQIEAVRANRVSVINSSTHNAAPVGFIEPMLKTLWDQGYPFNDLCPRESFTGCGATAMAQVMKYWNWPEQARGGHRNIYEPEQAVDFSQSIYDWANMIEDYESDCTDQQKAAVAKLMYDCGCGVNMFYEMGSATTATSITAALVKYFKYLDATLLNRLDYTDDWDEMLFNELQSGRPVIYFGADENGGHAFVCDGYAGDGYFHFNFGYHGAMDGNYLTTALPAFKDGQMAIIGITPDLKPVFTETDGILYRIIDENSASLRTFVNDLEIQSDVVIPATVSIRDKEYAVKIIEDEAFFRYTGMKNLTIPHTVDSIGFWAFSWCPIEKLYWNSNLSPYVVSFQCSESLREVVFGNDVRTVGADAFNCCRVLEKVTLPDSLIIIEDFAFRMTDITEVTIPSTVTEIGYCAFHCCHLKEVTIPSSVKRIDDYAFAGCERLTSVTFCNSPADIGERVFELCDSLQNVNLGDSIITLGYRAFSLCSSLKNFTFPHSLKYIGVECFYNCQLEKIVWDTELSFEPIFYDFTHMFDLEFGPTLTRVREGFLKGCTYVKSVTIPDNIIEIEPFAFCGCRALTDLSIPNSVTSIGEYAFAKTSLTKLSIPNSVTSLGTGLFFYSELETVTLSNSLTDIPDHAFNGCTKLTDVNIPNSVISIGIYSFHGCSGLVNVTVPNSVTDIGFNSFCDCVNMVTLQLGSSLRNIYYGAFSGCAGLKWLRIPDSVETISMHAFSGCTSLESVTLPLNLSYIEEFIFSDCPLKEVYVKWEDPFFIPDYVFTDYSGTLYVPYGTVEKYRAGNVWNNFNAIEEYDVVGIKSPNEERKIIETGRYRLDGKASNGYEKGIQIVRMNDGSVRKITNE